MYRYVHMYTQQDATANFIIFNWPGPAGKFVYSRVRNVELVIISVGATSSTSSALISPVVASATVIVVNSDISTAATGFWHVVTPVASTVRLRIIDCRASSVIRLNRHRCIELCMSDATL